MSQKQIKCGGWKTRRPKTAEYERRAVLSGYDAFNKTHVDNSRARLIAQIVNQNDGNPQNEFSSYYYGSQYNHPKYSATSHATYSPERRKRIIVSSYPSMVGLRWNSKVETSSVEDSRTDVANDHTFKCKCENCRMKYCRSKNPTVSITKTFKDNIMTFDDKCTMTLKLRDAFCAACSSPGTPKKSDVSITASCTRDVDTGCLNYNDFEPMPILKNRNDYKCERCGYKNEKDIDIIHQPEKDVEPDFKDCVLPRCIKSIFKRNKEKPIEVEPPRKTLYNEGINDVVASRFPLNPAIIPPPVNLHSDSSRVSIPSKSIPTKFNIPYSHTSQSRYHATCKRGSSRLKFDDDDELKHFVASPEVIRRFYTAKSVRHPTSPNIKLPRRVLTSQRDIESFVDKGPRSQSAKEKKKSWI